MLFSRKISKSTRTPQLPSYHASTSSIGEFQYQRTKVFR
uniref:Uncharacterized protein n=1 Tax=Rhizophora mucronata TaxID=61149 RepID=A0A2P2Q1T1_RHIMU